MHVETILFVGWGAIPVVAYAVGRVAISVRRPQREDPVQPTARLAELRAQRAVRAHAPRGRMSEAVRLAEAGSSTSVSGR